MKLNTLYNFIFFEGHFKEIEKGDWVEWPCPIMTLAAYTGDSEIDDTSTREVQKYNKYYAGAEEGEEQEPVNWLRIIGWDRAGGKGVAGFSADPEKAKEQSWEWIEIPKKTGTNRPKYTPWRMFLNWLWKELDKVPITVEIKENLYRTIIDPNNPKGFGILHPFSEIDRNPKTGEIKIGRAQYGQDLTKIGKSELMKGKGSGLMSQRYDFEIPIRPLGNTQEEVNDGMRALVKWLKKKEPDWIDFEEDKGVTKPDPFDEKSYFKGRDHTNFDEWDRRIDVAAWTITTPIREYGYPGGREKAQSQAIPTMMSGDGSIKKKFHKKWNAAIQKVAEYFNRNFDEGYEEGRIETMLIDMINNQLLNNFDPYTINDEEVSLAISAFFNTLDYNKFRNNYNKIYYGNEIELKTIPEIDYTSEIEKYMTQLSSELGISLPQTQKQIAKYLHPKIPDNIALRYIWNLYGDNKKSEKFFKKLKNISVADLYKPDEAESEDNVYDESYYHHRLKILTEDFSFSSISNKLRGLDTRTKTYSEPLYRWISTPLAVIDDFNSTETQNIRRQLLTEIYNSCIKGEYSKALKLLHDNLHRIAKDLSIKEHQKLDKALNSLHSDILSMRENFSSFIEKEKWAKREETKLLEIKENLYEELAKYLVDKGKVFAGGHGW